jgi:hypothetical protein
MKKMLYLLISLSVLGASACSSKKDDPVLTNSTAVPGYIVDVAVNGGTAAPLDKLQVLAATFGTAPSSLDLSGNLPDGRTLLVRYYGVPGRTATANAAPIGEISLIKASPASTQAGGSLTGNVSNNPNTNLAQGSFTATFPDGTAVSGTFRDLKTR